MNDTESKEAAYNEAAFLLCLLVLACFKDLNHMHVLYIYQIFTLLFPHSLLYFFSFTPTEPLLLSVK